METTTNDTKLAIWYDDDGNQKIVTIANYRELEQKKDKEELADFIYHRLHSRYLKPFDFSDKDYKKQYKNGFSIMANCCLLIETLQCFKEGIADSTGQSGEIFNKFFNEESNFTDFKGDDFYKNIRCGILHQGEIKGGYKIDRNDNKLFDANSLTISSVLFAEELKFSLKKYSNDLKTTDFDNDKLWKNFCKKMDSIIENCNLTNKN